MRVLPPDMPKKQADVQFALISRAREIQRTAAAKRGAPTADPPPAPAPLYDDEALFPPGSKLREELLRSGRLKPRNPPPSGWMRLFDGITVWLMNTPPATALVNVVVTLFFGYLVVALIGLCLGV